MRLSRILTPIRTLGPWYELRCRDKTDDPGPSKIPPAHAGGILLNLMEQYYTLGILLVYVGIKGYYDKFSSLVSDFTNLTQNILAVHYCASRTLGVCLTVAS